MKKIEKMREEDKIIEDAYISHEEIRLKINELCDAVNALMPEECDCEGQHEGGCPLPNEKSKSITLSSEDLKKTVLIPKPGSISFSCQNCLKYKNKLDRAIEEVEKKYNEWLKITPGLSNEQINFVAGLSLALSIMKRIKGE